MKPKASKAIPFIAGFFVLILLVGFSLGLRTVIEFDPVNAQVRTTKYLFIHLPVSVDSQTLWLANESMPDAPPDWKLMHEFHHSATGSNIHHTHWGALADTIMLWADLELSEEARASLARHTISLIDSDYSIKAKRVYALRLNTQLNRIIANAEPITPEHIDRIAELIYTNPIDAEASMFPDP